jgi:imidazole glycerol phosphate synthase subunit HisF
VYAAIAQGEADAVCLASILHYNYIKHYRAVDGDYSREGNVEFLHKGTGFSKIQDATISQIKDHLTSHGVDCRPALGEHARV